MPERRMPSRSASAHSPRSISSPLCCWPIPCTHTTRATAQPPHCRPNRKALRLPYDPAALRTADTIRMQSGIRERYSGESKRQLTRRDRAAIRARLGGSQP